MIDGTPKGAHAKPEPFTLAQLVVTYRLKNSVSVQPS